TRSRWRCSGSCSIKKNYPRKVQGRMTYSVRGFDVAEVNRDNRGRRIDWKAVGEAGEVQFCGIRVLDGKRPDADGDYNCEGAASIGLPFLPYQPFYPRIDAKEQ